MAPSEIHEYWCVSYVEYLIKFNSFHPSSQFYIFKTWKWVRLVPRITYANLSVKLILIFNRKPIDSYTLCLFLCAYKWCKYACLCAWCIYMVKAYTYVLCVHLCLLMSKENTRCLAAALAALLAHDRLFHWIWYCSRG